MRLTELLADQAPVRKMPDARTTIRKALVDSAKRIVVIDDDPTGMQTVQDVPVYMDWSLDTLRAAVASPQPVLFVSVNSRSLSPAEAEALAFATGRNLREAAALEHIDVLLASRSDSTLRGHFPYEVDALLAGYGIEPDGVLIAPAFFEAGRYTVNDTQYAEQDGHTVPVHETEFARDPVFSYKNSNLKAWVEEKTRGAVTAADVRSIGLRLLREVGPDGVALELLKASDGVPVIVNGTCYEDFEVFCLGLQLAEQRGKRFVYRCSASFLKARGGFEDRPLLSREQMVTHPGPGLVVAGSYVGKTSRQLQRLLASGLARGIELRVGELGTATGAESEVSRVTDAVEQTLAGGINAALFTSRDLLVKTDQDFSETGKSVMQALCQVVRRISLRPAFVVAKGGITSIETAKTAMSANEAWSLGQILPGVPVWRLGDESRWPGISLVVFPGNVGDDDALMHAVRTLTG